MKIFYTWNQFDRDIKDLAHKLKQHKQLTSVYGIPRGGLIPAVALSHTLTLPIILDSKKITPATLVVDDIADNGDTLKRVLKGEENKCIIVTLWATEKTIVKPNFYCNTKTDEWIVFPWETKQSSQYDHTT